MIIRPTQFQELGYSYCEGNLWRIIDTKTKKPVGPQYKNLEELFADLYRFAEVFGCAKRK